MIQQRACSVGLFIALENTQTFKRRFIQRSNKLLETEIMLKSRFEYQNDNRVVTLISDINNICFTLYITWCWWWKQYTLYIVLSSIKSLFMSCWWNNKKTTPLCKLVPGRHEYVMSLLYKIICLITSSPIIFFILSYVRMKYLYKLSIDYKPIHPSHV